MSDPLVEGDDEANTPLTPAERNDLIPTYITTRAELNAAEQENIAEAELWAFTRRRDDIVDRYALLALHRRMFRRVWRWAGRIRNSERNIGAAPHLIETGLEQLIGDVRYWIDHGTFRQTRSRCDFIIDWWRFTLSRMGMAAMAAWLPTF